MSFKKGRELGITHLQLDDGWQQGLSKNSINLRRNIMGPVEQGGLGTSSRKISIRIWAGRGGCSRSWDSLGLWFHPSNADSYSFWKQDAEIILDLYENGASAHLRLME